MKLLLCALVLTIPYLSPQQETVIPVKCVMVNVAPFRLVCNDKDKTELVFESAGFPEVWIGRGLGGTYNAELRDGKLFAVSTPAEPEVTEQTRAKVLREMKRWRIPPTQASGRP